MKERLERLKAYLRSERSQGLTEFAIIAPVILLLTFGIIDFGRGLYLYITLQQAGCLIPTDSNGNGNKPYPAAAYPATSQTVNVYICYTAPNGTSYGSIASHPTDNSFWLGDINVSLLMNFQLITPLIQGLFGNGLDLAYNEHFTIQGKP